MDATARARGLPGYGGSREGWGVGFVVGPTFWQIRPLLDKGSALKRDPLIHLVPFFESAILMPFFSFCKLKRVVAILHFSGPLVWGIDWQEDARPGN